MKRSIIFKDADSNKVTFDATIKTDNNNNLVFSASGDYCSSSGQCFDDVKPKTDAQRELINLWREYHLNDMNAGTKRQTAIVKGKGYDYDQCLQSLCNIDRHTGKETFLNYKAIIKDIEKFKDEITSIDNWYKKASVSASDIETGKYYETKRAEYVTELFLIEEQLNKTLVYDVDPRDENKLYKYGSAWLVNELPEDFEDNLNELMDAIEAEEEEEKERPVTIDDISLFEDFSEPETALAIALMLNLCVNEIEDIEEGSNYRWTVQGVDYLAGNDAEMDEVWNEYLENYIDECLEIPKEMGRYFDREAWKSDARMDGRGHSLNSYDGGEEEIKVNETYYYMYKN
jgi:hypothetical protein